MTQGAKQSLQKKYLERLLATGCFYLAQLKIISKIRAHARGLAAIYDLLAIAAAFLAATYLTNALSASSLLKISCLIFTQFLVARALGLSRGFWRFASIQDLQKIILSALLGSVMLATLYQQSIITALLYGLLLISFLSAARFFIRTAKDYKNRYYAAKRVIIIGAGNAGEGLARDLLRDHRHYKPIAFVDDETKKIGREIHGIPIVGTVSHLPNIAKKSHPDLILIAIPSASAKAMRAIAAQCEATGIAYYTLPGLKDLTHGHVDVNTLRHLQLEDLIGRDPITHPEQAIKHILAQKTVLITGGGGSIGAEICRQIAALNFHASLIIVDNNEYNLYSIELELIKKYPNCHFSVALLSITDRAGIEALFEKHHPDIVFHAAAYKHVPLLQSEPRVAMFNNIIGTKIVANAALHANVQTFVLISSDKAVHPANIMGATKRAAEQICQQLNEQQRTRFITVRFGNVLDSVGSVIPLFRKQIETGGPVTVTHPDITRFFMTIPEAAQLILQATHLGQGGEVFVLEMGEPVKITYLAEQMIKLAGKVVNQDIKITYTGLRPGEKLYEECFYQNEMLQKTTHPKILMATARFNETPLQPVLLALEQAYLEPKTPSAVFVELLKQLVPEYLGQPLERTTAQPSAEEAI